MGAPVQSHLCVAESESGPKCPNPQAVCPQPHSACDKCGGSILQAGILPRPPLFCTNLSHPPEEGGHSALTAAESVSSFARWGRGASDPWPSQPPLPGRLDLSVLETQSWRWKPAPSPLATLSASFLLAAGPCLLVASSLITQTLLPHDLCLVGTMFLSHNMNFLSHFPGVQLSSDSC